MLNISMTNKNKVYVTYKYVIADSVKNAIKKEKDLPVDECFLEPNWKNNNIPKLDVDKKPGF